jgi:hypothetical protein
MVSRRGYGRDVNRRQAAATLAAVAASAAPAQAGMVKQTGSGIQLRMPKPAVMPQFVVDPTIQEGGAGNDLANRTVRSSAPLGRYARRHELFHTLDHDEFSQADREALARIVAPKRAGEASTDWWGKTGPEAAGRPGLAEIAADYYATAKVQQPSRRAGKFVVSQSEQSYTRIRDKRMAEFRRFMDQWARTNLR